MHRQIVLHLAAIELVKYHTLRHVTYVHFLLMDLALVTNDAKRNINVNADVAVWMTLPVPNTPLSQRLGAEFRLSHRFTVCSVVSGPSLRTGVVC